MMVPQFKKFIDSTGGLWRTQALASKPTGIFYSTRSQGSGQETTPETHTTTQEEGSARASPLAADISRPRIN
ncbi:hypothetical protein Pfo_018999, partial [Paulownia fortunei]